MSYYQPMIPNDWERICTSCTSCISARSSEKLHVGTAGHAKALQILLAAVAQDLTVLTLEISEKLEKNLRKKGKAWMITMDHLIFPISLTNSDRRDFNIAGT